MIMTFQIKSVDSGDIITFLGANTTILSVVHPNNTQWNPP